jgi:RHS repeat-associated protein
MTGIKWPDGYEIDVSYDLNGRLSIVQDNKGHHATYTWSSNGETIDSVAIDTDYDQLQSTPEINVSYHYQQYPQMGAQLLTQSLVTQVNTGAVLTQYDYTYTPETILASDPPGGVLNGILDGRLDANGLPIQYAEFEYAAGGLARAVRTKHAGDVDAFIVFPAQLQPLPQSVPDTEFMVTTGNPLGKGTSYDFDYIEGRPRVLAQRGHATQSCLGTAQSFDYTPSQGSMGANGYVYERIEKNGSKTTFDRDVRGLILTKTEDADGAAPRVTTYTWHSDFRLPLTRTTTQMEETFVYDADGLLTSYSQTDVLTGSPSNSSSRTWDYSYTALASGLKVLTSLDGPGLIANNVNDVTTYTYNADGTMATQTDPNGFVTTYATYDGFGNVTRIVQSDGVAMSLTYDAKGQPTQIIENVDQTSSNTSTFTYDVIGQLTSFANGSGATWNFTYSGARRLVEIQNPNGEKATFQHDLMGNVTKTEYSTAGGTVAFFQDSSFDELGRLMNALGANGQVTGLAYDEEDNTKTITDPQQLVTTRNYDALNRVVQEVDRAAGSAEMAHDDADQIVQYTDPRDIDTGFAYNGFGETVSETSADRGTITYVYDTRGQVVSMTDARGIVSTYSYDNGGRLKTRQFPATPAENQTFQYDYTNNNSQGADKIFRIIDESGRIERRYSNGGYVNLDRRLIDGKQYSTKYKVDGRGRLVQITTPARLEIKISYDSQDRVKYMSAQRRVKDPITNQYPAKETIFTSTTYAPNGPLVSMTYGDGATHVRSYDTSYRLTGIVDQRSSTTLRDISYGWTNRDNLASITDNQVPANSETYTYSPREFLSQAVADYGQIDYGYDPVGNRTSKATTLGAFTLTDNYTYPLSSNRLQSIASGSTGTRQLTYDTAGNVVQDSQTGSYSYNAANRLERFMVNGVIQAEYTYNTLGQQVLRELPVLGKKIHVVHDLEGNRLAEYEIDLSTGVSTLLQEYIWLNGAPVAVVDGQTNEVFFIRTDHIGRPVFATDDTGAKAWEASYLPFGGVHQVTGAALELRFPGQWFQMETGLHQNWMRDYDPTTGRYMQADPLGLVDGASVYGYALQNPGRYTDPRGERSRTFNGSPAQQLQRELLGTQNGASQMGTWPQSTSPSFSYFPNGVFGEGDGNSCRYCPPCSPYPAGSIGYRSDHHPVSIQGIGDFHLNLYKVHQNPKTCECFIRRNKPYHVNPPAQPDWFLLPSQGRGPRDGFPNVNPLPRF